MTDHAVSAAAVAVTGAVDDATDEVRVVVCRNGHPMMTRVTGLGCTATAIVGACPAVEERPLAARVRLEESVGVLQSGPAPELGVWRPLEWADQVGGSLGLHGKPSAPC